VGGDIAEVIVKIYFAGNAVGGSVDRNRFLILFPDRLISFYYKEGGVRLMVELEKVLKEKRRLKRSK